MSESFVTKRKQSLLSKYNVPLENLSFEFIKSCSDYKILEKIVKVLRSGEEGHYPQLLTAAEDKLRELNPKARILRVLEPVAKTVYPSADATQALLELKEWSSKISIVEKELAHLNRCRMPSYPEVRNAPSGSSINSAEVVKTKQAIKTTDYSSWDKYDPDAELLKLEIEEERKKAEQKKEKERKAKEESERLAQELSRISNESMFLATSERAKIAEDKRIKGNEYFKAKDFHQAVKYYSESIAIQETAAAYCNRALAYMKLNENFQAINDCTACLHYEPQNVKALFRRAQGLQSMKEYHAALKDVTYLLEIEPSNSAAVTLRNSLLNQIGSSQIISRRNVLKRRIMVEDDDSYSKGCVKIIEVSEDELRKYSKYEYIELNEKNQLKGMCMCSLDANYHSRLMELYHTSDALISSPFYRITRVKHCYPVKVYANRPSTSAVINSNYLHVGIHTNYRTPVRNIFVVSEPEKPVYNGSYFNQQTSNTTLGSNLNKVFDFRPRQNINETIAKTSHIDRHKGVLKNDLQKIMEVSRGIAEKRVDNMSTRLEILEIDSSATKSATNGNVVDEKSNSLTNGNHESISKSSSAPGVSSSSCGRQESANKLPSSSLNPHQNDSFNHCNGTKQLNGNSSLEKSKFALKECNSASTNGIITETDPNIANNNTPISAQCHGDDESEPDKKHGNTESDRCEPKINGFSHSSEDLTQKAKHICKAPDDSNKSSSKIVNGQGLSNGQPGVTPFQFMSQWQNVERSKGLSEYELLLRQVKPSSLSSMFSNQLDDRMLSAMLSTLHSRFKLKDEFDLVIDYLTAIAELKRFGIALCLLPPADVKVVRALFNDLESVIHVDLNRLSQFIQLKQAYLC